MRHVDIFIYKEEQTRLLWLALIGAVVFVIVFVIVTLLSRFPLQTLPPAATILGWFIDVSIIPEAYRVWVIGLVNGVIYGVIIWAGFSIVKFAVIRGKKKAEKTDLASCPKCKNIVAASKTWSMTTRPSSVGKRTEMKIGLFECPQCGKSFRRVLSKKDVY